MLSSKPIIVVPMAGSGSRFSVAGYLKPKPLIEFLGASMIEHVVNSVPIEADWIFIVQQTHIDLYDIDRHLQKIKPGCKVIPINGVTDGAARTVLSAQDAIDNDRPLCILNSDNILDWDAAGFWKNFEASTDDGAILVFHDTDPKWSFVKIVDGFAVEVAEKKPISDLATAGLYVWRKGSSFVKAALQMIDKNIRVNNEFYVCPVYNENILDGQKISCERINRMHGVGTPDDLIAYIRFKAGSSQD